MGWGWIGDVGDAIGDAASEVGGAVKDAVGEAGGVIGDTLGAAGQAVDTVTFGGASALMGAVDDTVFASISALPGVEVHWDGGLSAEIGIPGVASTGMSIGEHGVTASGEVGAADLDVGLTDEGFQLSGEAGIDWGPLPYGRFETEVTDDGEVMIDGELQGTLPIPGVGIVSGHVAGGFVQTSEGWGTFIESDGKLVLPSGVTVTGGFQGSYQETADGSHATLGANAGISYQGIGQAGVSAGYERIEQGGDVIETFQAGAQATGLGMSAGAQTSYVGAEIGGVEHSEWTGDAAASIPGVGEWSTKDVPVGDSPSGGAATDLDDDVVLGTSGQDPVTLDVPPVVIGGDVPDPVSGVPVDDPLAAPIPDVAAPPPEPVVEPAPVVEAPVDEFDQSIDAAEQIESSMGDVFDDVG